MNPVGDATIEALNAVAVARHTHWLTRASPSLNQRLQSRNTAMRSYWPPRRRTLW